MTKRTFRLQMPKAIITMIALAGLFLLPSLVLAQNTTGGTVISNQATAAYEDDASTPYTTVSNVLEITVANVSGLAITPDASSIATVVPGQTGVQFPFTITNTSNYAAKIHFLASGASIQVTNGNVTAAFIDYNTNGVLDGADQNIFSDIAAVDTTAAIAKDASISVVVVVTVTVSTGDVTVQLGDASATSGSSTPFDEQLSDSSTHEVRTNSGVIVPVNDESEAEGTLKSTVEADASLKVTLEASSAGPLPYSVVGTPSNITYTTRLRNMGKRAAGTVSLTGNAGVYIIANIPDDTALTAGQTWPAGTLFTTDALGTENLDATYSGTEPTLTSITRVAFKVGSSLAAETTSADFVYVVTIDLAPFDATLGIRAYTNAYATDYLGNPLTDRAGDDIAASAGAAVVTTIAKTGNVQIGTSGFPDAENTDTNDDYTNKSVNAGIAGVVFGGNTTAGGTLVYVNTLKNTGNADDIFTITAPLQTPLTGFTVKISTNGGGSYTDVSNGTASVTVAIPYDQTADVWVEITAPTGKAVITGFSTVIHAASGITSANTNETIDRLYTGFIRLTKTAVILNGDLTKGTDTDPVPGAMITYTVAYSNIASTGGTNCPTLNAKNFIITENGTTGGNNWGTYTSHVINSAVDSRGGTITGNGDVTSTLLTDTVTTVATVATPLLAGQSGTFSFQRLIK